ncbi:OX-2 membrane glycoprotein-like isoform X1 [Chelmon rostratus]|uniref:OX-2 membrane glycoprotein-like isoform X1 n=1 Tax=Chelmon rostratus TaxID=109905 RepID=UPI001BE68F2E|nr:OX-2 membrane glycoprotein-like isoform X1 [Chelmon rostratus]
MTSREFIHLICAFGLFHEGLTALIQTQRTVMAAEGKEAQFSCQLTQSKDVLQVTWQKRLPSGEKNLCTFNKYFGQRVNPDFRDKVEFEAAGLQNSSIVIRKVTELDEGCYHCLFNTYPEGALKGTTCLHLYELHEPILHVRQSNSSEEALVSCSATGRPAPTVILRVLQKDLHLSGYSSVSVTNSNGTVTVTAAAVLSASNDSSTQVGCAVRVLSGPQIETSVTLPEVKRSSADGLFEESEPDDDSSVTWIIVCVFVVFSVCCVAVIISVLLLQQQKKSVSRRDSEDIRTPQKLMEHTHETKTPLMQQESEQVRLRVSTGSKQSKNSPKVSSGTAKRQLF